MKIATSAYPLTPLENWAAYDAKLTQWVENAAGQGAELLVFPEYGAMELASFGGDIPNDMESALRAVSDLIPRADALQDRLARDHGVYILAGSAPVYRDQPRPTNTARMFGPDGPIGMQDKQIMTMVERRDMDVRPGDPLCVFDTPIGRFGVLICYDVEFPELGRALVQAGVQVILAPSYTGETSGYWRVRIGAMARALEGQCVTVHAPCLSDGTACPPMNQATGAAGVFGPPDIGFPDNGILALGEMGAPGWIIADVSLDDIAHVRQHGRVRNFTHWDEQAQRLAGIKTTAAE